MALLEPVLIGLGLSCLAVLLVIGAIALVQDWLSERAKTRRAIAAVRDEMASRRARAPQPQRSASPLGGRHAA
jgi:hypothetical protein